MRRNGRRRKVREERGSKGKMEAFTAGRN